MNDTHMSPNPTLTINVIEKLLILGEKELLTGRTSAGAFRVSLQDSQISHYKLGAPGWFCWDPSGMNERSDEVSFI